jgi:hypothetical protein
MKKVMIHLSLWVFWYSSTNITYIVNYKDTPWIPAFYNFISFAAVFYLSNMLAKNYFSRVSLSDGLKKMPKRWLKYFLFRQEVIGFLALILGNILISWNIDQFLLGQRFGSYLSEDFWFYADSKFARMAFYIGAGIGFALINEVGRRKNEIIAQKDAYIENQAARLTVEKYDNKFLRDTIEERDIRYKLLENYINDRLS